MATDFSLDIDGKQYAEDIMCFQFKIGVICFLLPRVWLYSETSRSIEWANTKFSIQENTKPMLITSLYWNFMSELLFSLGTPTII